MDASLLVKTCSNGHAGEKTWWNKPGFHLSYMEDYPPYPYQRIKSEDGKDTGVVALIAPFYDLTYYRVCPAHFQLAVSLCMSALCTTPYHAHGVCPGAWTCNAQSTNTTAVHLLLILQRFKSIIIVLVSGVIVCFIKLVFTVSGKAILCAST